MAEIKLVKMEREDGAVADVHPDEVENYAEGGFRIVYSDKDVELQADKPKKGKK